MWDATCCTGAQKLTSLWVQLQVNLLDGRSDLLLFCTLPLSACVVGVGVKGQGAALRCDVPSQCLTSPFASLLQEDFAELCSI